MRIRSQKAIMKKLEELVVSRNFSPSPVQMDAMGRRPTRSTPSRAELWVNCGIVARSMSQCDPMRRRFTLYFDYFIHQLSQNGGAAMKRWMLWLCSLLTLSLGLPSFAQ